MVVTAQQQAPWEAVPASKQLFVLVTGANSGVGLGICQRLIDEFLATRPLDAHLILLPTTRSPSKSLAAIRNLRAHAKHTAQSSKELRSRSGGDDYRWQHTVARVHVLSLSLDLCDLRGVRAFARRLCGGVVSNPPGLEGEYLCNVRVPRLDSVICNAAYGGWTGCNYPMALWIMATKGLVQAVTWPTFKIALPTSILNEQPRYNYVCCIPWLHAHDIKVWPLPTPFHALTDMFIPPNQPDKPLLGEVFTACVFGHYMLTHELLPLLSRRSNPEDGLHPGRVVWSSSVEAVRNVFDLDDIQAFIRPIAYESAKRLTDIIALTSSLPAVRPVSEPFLRPSGNGDDVASKNAGATPQSSPEPPKMYVTHPGIVLSSLFPVPWFLLWAYELALIISRWLGSPWHTVDGYTGAKSAVWVTLEPQPALDAAHADRIKWGSSSDRQLRTAVKKTEVEGWGWEGKVEDPAADSALGVLQKTVGRKHGVVDATASDIAEFEEGGVRVWQTMEQLRIQWTEILDEEEDEASLQQQLQGES